MAVLIAQRTQGGGRPVLYPHHPVLRGWRKYAEGWPYSNVALGYHSSTGENIL
jgi:hypothetical protein